MKNRPLWILLIAAGSAPAWWLGGCSSSDTPAVGDAGTGETGSPSVDAAVETGSPALDSGIDSGIDSAVSDAGVDVVDSAPPPTVTGMAITTTTGGPLRAAPGDALPLQVVFTMSDGTVKPVSFDVTWTAPGTIAAQDPNDAGPASSIPDGDGGPTTFYVANDFRIEHPGVLFVVSAGATADAGVTVKATLPDAGELEAVVSLSPMPVGDAARGQNLFQTVLICSSCHGTTAGGSPPTLLSDGGVVYDIQGTQYPYPAPPLNADPDAGDFANDPEWNSALLGLASQADIDNFGVALRVPMPVWLGKPGATGQPLNAQDFADIYAWLKTQK